MKVLCKEGGLEEDPDYDGWTIVDIIYGHKLFLSF